MHTVKVLPFIAPLDSGGKASLTERRESASRGVVVAGFVRLLTHPSMLQFPATLMQAVNYVEQWFQFSHVTPLNPGREHLAIFRRALDAAGVGGNLVTDSHIAALAMEYQAEVHSNDTDFSRFPGLRWRNPL